MRAVTRPKSLLIVSRFLKGVCAVAAIQELVCVTSLHDQTYMASITHMESYSGVELRWAGIAAASAAVSREESQ
jgi:hypothetical protein